jgi:uncharacterized protein (DUF488 family)
MIWTIGHSTRSAEDYMALLRVHEIGAVTDVRRFPGSRRHPQFGREALAHFLAEHHVEYHWIGSLGGRRRAVGTDTNSAWRNASFRAYGEFIHTAEFAAGLDQLLELARRSRTAIMCAELLWWRCHRAIIADVLHVRGIPVVHIVDEKQTTVHPLTGPARIIDGRLSYSAVS